MFDLEPMRKIINGVTINTETAYCFHQDIKIIAEQVNGQLENTHIIQSLYQAPDGQYFLAFWNKPEYDVTILGYRYTDEVVIIDSDKAKNWLLNRQPDLHDKFIASLDKSLGIPDTLTLRIPIDLRNHLLTIAQRENKSLNSLCLHYINSGL